jgi:hypothetical protein
VNAAEKERAQKNSAGTGAAIGCSIPNTYARASRKDAPSNRQQIWSKISKAKNQVADFLGRPG